ncbi:MAG: hypothetical protein F6K58_15350 [Symploca sp. SIO2E9]|nr:hypothetical protein [Symploca sp. SIO2E9]
MIKISISIRSRTVEPCIALRTSRAFSDGIAIAKAVKTLKKSQTQIELGFSSSIGPWSLLPPAISLSIGDHIAVVATSLSPRLL